MKLHCLLFALAATTVACSDDDAPGVDSDEEARRAYLGLDTSIEKSITLGFAGFNAATNANIPDQMGAGDVGGTLLITGQVDQGASNNKNMRLYIGMVAYNDGPVVIEEDGEQIEIDITYTTNAVEEMRPHLEMKLNAIPDSGDQAGEGTWTGSLTGDYTMAGELEGTATLGLMFSGKLKRDASDKVIRTPGSTTVTGTATSGDGTFAVNLTL